jgi:hypothetical protein
MLNVLQRGYQELAVDERRRLWQYDTFTVQDLLVYLAATTTLADMQAALIPVGEVTPIEPVSMVRAKPCSVATRSSLRRTRSIRSAQKKRFKPGN